MGLFTDNPSLPHGTVDEEKEVLTEAEVKQQLAELGLEETAEGFKKIEPDEKKEPEKKEENMTETKEPEVKTRTDEDIAELLYGKPKEEAAGEVEEPQKTEEPQKLKDRTEEEIAATVYPEKSPLYADVDEAGNVSAVIRELETGRIMAKSRHGSREDLIGCSSPLPFADLSGIKLVGKSLDHGNYHDSSIAGSDCEGLSVTWSDLRNINAEGASLKSVNFGFSDLRGMQVSSETDISQANFEGAAIDQVTYDGLIKCKGASSAKGLAVREMPPAKSNR